MGCSKSFKCFKNLKIFVWYCLKQNVNQTDPQWAFSSKLQFSSSLIFFLLYFFTFRDKDSFFMFFFYVDLWYCPSTDTRLQVILKRVNLTELLCKNVNVFTCLTHFPYRGGYTLNKVPLFKRKKELRQSSRYTWYKN